MRALTGRGMDKRRAIATDGTIPAIVSRFKGNFHRSAKTAAARCSILIAVNSCYDGRRPLQSMSVRALTAALMVLVSATAEGEVNGRKPWQATVAPPRPGLPAVT